jgi:hypothetical protein
LTGGISGRYTGGETGKASLLPQAKTQLLKALHLDPSNNLLRFNLATVMQANPFRHFPHPLCDWSPVQQELGYLSTALGFLHAFCCASSPHRGWQCLFMGASSLRKHC